MKKILIFCLFVVSLTFLSLAGCKIKITVPEGGYVTTESGSYDCRSGQVCTIDVYDIYFDETFIAVPDSGSKFISWRKKHRGLCGGNNKPCHLFTTGFLGNDALMAILESDTVFYLEPVFEMPSDADLWVGLYDYGYGFRYCDRKGLIWYEFGIRNFGPGVAKDVVFKFEQELFKAPITVPSLCTSWFGVISCPIGDLEVASRENNWTPTYYLKFRSDYFRNTKNRQLRAKITLSSSSEDLNPSDNIKFWTRSLSAFPKNNGWCDPYYDFLD